MRVDYFNIIHSAMVYHPNEFETAVTLGQNEPHYCNVPDSLSESLARARLTFLPGLEAIIRDDQLQLARPSNSWIME